MLYSLEQVLGNRPPLITIRQDAPLLDALKVLIERRFGQLPVVDETGRLRGVVSQQAILGVYHLTDGKVPLFDLSVVDCMDPANKVSLQDDLLSAFDLLGSRGVYAVVVAQEERPVGILTPKDVSVLFRSIFEGLLLVERIERRLAAALRLAFPTEDAFTKALISVYGADKRDPNKPQRDGQNLSLTDMVFMIRDNDVWPFFEPLFGNRDYFRHLMDSVRQVRNEMAHFRGQVDVLEMDTLRRAVVWLENRLPLPAFPGEADPATSGRAASAVETLASVIGNRKPVVCTSPDVPLREALRTMIENRFGQLPVTDEHGHLLGMVSQQSILRTYYHTDGAANLLDLPVAHCVEAATTLHPNEDLFQAANVLAQSGEYAPVVVEDDKPVGILTGKDMTRFFRGLFEGIILIERIEARLRDYMDKAFPEAALLNEAAKRVFGPSPNHPELAARSPDRFTFADHVLFICDDDLWSAYEAALGSREVFMQLMDRARRIRNSLLHFRGSLSNAELDALRKTYGWLSQRPMADAAPPLPPAEARSGERATSDNPYFQVMGRKLRTLPLAELEE